MSLLTDRERQIVALIAQGRPNDRIAAALRISPSTVKTHLTYIASKLDASGRANIVYRAIQTGDLEVTPQPAPDIAGR